ncbi:glycosyltransferase family 4 protein [Candidatus Woesearchaeota archaeon]|nr:glycosyltransferase family 4 protein [Candidatus Woesearchaeota archaeon]
MKKFVQVVMAVGSGCHYQTSPKEKYFYNSIDVMKKKGFTPEFWTLRQKGEKKKEIVDRVMVRRFQNPFSLVATLLLKPEVKMIHAHLRPFLPSLLSPLAMKRCVLTPHTYELGSTSLIRKMSVFFMKRFTKVIALTPYEKELYEKQGMKNVVLMPHAIDIAYFSKKPKDLSKIRKQYNIKSKDFVITSVSNFRKFKNLDTMIEAFGIMSKKIKDAKFFLVGINQLDNPRYKEQSGMRYKDVANPGTIIKKYGIQDRVILTGGLDYQKVRDILAVSHVFINSSDPETMGLSVYEAAAHGVPLCLSRIGSFTTVFGDRVLYSPPRSPEQLALQYQKYYKQPSLQKQNGQRVKRLMKQWDYPLFMKKLDKLYSDVIACRKS